MTILEMLEQSAILTVLGMAVVFIFLWFMAVCVDLVGKLLRTKDRDTSEPAASVPPDHIAAISAALTEYRTGGKS